MIKTKKSLGQHFLRSERALSTIIEAGNIVPGETILEIGPGRGALTRRLLDAGAKVIAVEKDDELYEFLQQEYGKEIKNRKLELIHADILDFDLSKLAPRNYKLIANIPYNITGAIIRKFLETDNQPERMVLLVQKEVARRIVGQLGSPTSKLKESILSISVKAYGTPKYIETVKAGSFVPAPKVDSAIISIENISKDFFKTSAVFAEGYDVLKEGEFFEMVRAGFKSKRKKLSSNLSTIFPKSKVRNVFQKLKLDDNLRAEDTDIETWKKLVYLLVSVSAHFTH